MGFELVNGLAGRHPGLDAVMVFAAGSLSYPLFAVAVLVGLTGLRDRDRGAHLWMVGQAGAALVLSFLISRALRTMALHERPFQHREVTQLLDHDPGVSFPSNHATAVLTVALVVAVFISLRWGALLAVPAVLVAVARVYVGVHWPSDIIAAAAVAVVAVTVVWWTARWLRQRPRPEPDPGPPDQPAAIPDQPAAIPDRPTVIPDRPTVTPDRPTVTPDRRGFPRPRAPRRPTPPAP